MPKKPSEMSAGVQEAIADRLSEIATEIGELEDERKRLEAARSQLDAGKGKRRPGRPRQTHTAQPGPSPGKARGKRGASRADQAVKVIEKSPGLGASEVAKIMKIKPAYLYRVLGNLEEAGRVKKDGRRYFPA